MRVGVLALQGGVSEHERALRGTDPHIEVHLIRNRAALETVDGIILPGGESTVQRRLLNRLNMTGGLRSCIERGVPVWGTCAGAILLARNISKEEEESGAVGTLDLEITRNWYGSQLESFVDPLAIKGMEGSPFPGVFIRAPGIVKHGSSVEVLAWYQSLPVAVRQGNMLATTFHPELVDDRRIHQLFLQMIQESKPHLD